ncbi:MAG: methyltransferase domain-containing protein, partial [Spirochaetaceae bacterium]|nr:methyltransferase domain-containing protein [Spirochaetaceae bacterium]
MPADRILFIPASAEGEGTGHKRRCGRLAAELGNRGMVLEGSMPPSGMDVELRQSGAPDGFLRSLAVFDRRISTTEDLVPWTEKATPILLDDDGEARRTAPYLIDIIPGPRRTEANASSPDWLDLPSVTRTPDAAGPVLVSFGGEDKAGLTLPVLRFLVESIGAERLITATCPESITEDRLPSGVRILREPQELKGLLGDFGLVITSYGITLWEAVAAGCAVLTVDPTPYHAKLSSAAGVPGIGKIRFNLDNRLSRSSSRALDRRLKSTEYLNRAAENLRSSIGDRRRNLAETLAGFEAPKPRCAVCGAPLPAVIARFPTKTYYRCSDCGMIGLYRFTLKNDEYGSSYFQDEYRLQYGRSYLEDFPAIERMARSRLDVIGHKAVPKGSLLDVGCAFGPFLKAADESGYHCRGIDVSAEGVKYIRETLGLSAETGRFPGDNPKDLFGVDGFDVVTLWYVIEHFPDLDRVLKVLS